MIIITIAAWTVTAATATGTAGMLYTWYKANRIDVNALVDSI